jgi:group I intron endonuclease
MKIIDLDSKNKICGIYKILCTANNEFYIGSSKDILYRLKIHASLLSKNKYINTKRKHGCKSYMQNAYNKYGAESFKYFVLEQCVENILLTREQYYLTNLQPKFNSSHKAGRPPLFSELTNEQQQRKIKNNFISRTKNNTFKQSKESMQKMIQTKIKNGTLCVPQPWRRGIKNPAHSKRMKKIFLTKKAAMTKEEIVNHPFYGKKTQPTNLKPKLKLKNSITGEINELYGIDWNRQYGITMPAISRLRYNRQDFVIDRDKQKWNKVIEKMHTTE